MSVSDSVMSHSLWCHGVCSPPGSFVHWIFPARILEWGAILFSRVSSNPRIEPRSPALQADSLPSEQPGTQRDFIFLGLKITANGDCSHEIKRRLLLGRKAMTSIDSILKSRDITLLTKVHKVSSVQFSCSVVSNSLRPHEPQHARPPCPSPTPRAGQIHTHQAGDAIQPSHPLSSPSPPTFNLSQHQGLFKWVSSSHQVAKVLEFQLQHQSFQRVFRVDFL